MMPSRLRLLSIPVCAAAICALLVGADTPTSESFWSHADSIAVVKAVNEFQTALSTGDSAKALSLLAPDAVILESGGMETRSEYRTAHLREDIKFAKAVKSKRSSLRVRTEGPVAWTFGTSTAQGEFSGRAVNSMGAESMVLTKHAGGWRIRSIHWSSRNRTTSP